MADYRGRVFNIEGCALAYPTRFRDGIIEIDRHRVAKDLRRLGLPCRPLFAGWSGHLEFQMSHPEPL